MSLFKKVLGGSWRTTAAGVVGGLAILFGQAAAVLDDDPKTQPSLEQVLAGLGLMGLGVAAADKNGD